MIKRRCFSILSNLTKSMCPPRPTLLRAPAGLFHTLLALLIWRKIRMETMHLVLTAVSIRMLFALACDTRSSKTCW